MPKTSYQPGGEPMRLNLGCGQKKDHKLGYVNVDHNPACQPDVVLRIDRQPWPWPEDSACEILLDNVLEHVGWGPNDEDLLMHVMNEAHRVLVVGGTLWYKVPDVEKWPYGAFRDPTHRRFFCLGSSDYWNADHQTHRNYGRTYGYLPWTIIANTRTATSSHQVFIEVTMSPVK